MIAFACIAPHGDIEETAELQAAMEELGRRCERAQVETAIVVSPHTVHVEGHFAVVTAGRVGEIETDRELAGALLAGLREASLPAVGVSYGGNVPAEAQMPLDWGTEIPLRFVRADRIVVVAPARDLPLGAHVRAGAAIARATSAPSNSLLQAKRVALVASADNGHAHDPDGPYGFHEAAAAYDARLQELLAATPLDFLPLAELVEDAKADSLWQLLVLQGAVGEQARAETLAYAAPTYYGMLVAEVRTP
ncbi:MAG: extradiol ring-cleavage dioxygenase [Gaiellaceae bacterium]